MKGIMTTILLLTISISTAKAETCTKLTECIELVSKLTSKAYILDKDIKGDVSFSKSFQITKKNADDFISEVLHLSGYTRIPSLTENTWIVINARDFRYHSTPLYTKDLKNIPNNYDYIMVQIKLKNPYIVSTLASSFRPFISRYGRVIDLKETHEIFIADTAKNIRRLLKIIENTDKKPTSDEIEAYKKREKKQQKLKELKIRYGTEKSSHMPHK